MSLEVARGDRLQTSDDHASIAAGASTVNRDGRLIVTVPEAVEASADDLAPALQSA